MENRAFKLLLVLSQLSAWLRDLLEKEFEGLTPQQFLTLFLVKEGKNPSAIAGELLISPAVITGHVSRLERKGHIADRQRSSEDRRVRILTLIPEGEEVLGKVLNILNEKFESAFTEHFQDDGYQMMIEDLEVVIRHLL